MTKKDAAMHALGLARDMHRELAGDAYGELWILRLLWLAQDLYPPIAEHSVYFDIVTSGGDTRRAKLRRLIEHRATPSAEREAAVIALERLRAAGWPLG